MLVSPEHVLSLHTDTQKIISIQGAVFLARFLPEPENAPNSAELLPNAMFTLATPDF